MKAIIQNPYRILGLLASATAREQAKQINKLKKYIEAEQEPEKDFSFPVFGKLQRTVDSVEDASQKLTLDVDKIRAALFWFYKGNDITDEPALEALKDGDISTACQIWNKLIFEVKEDDSKCFKAVTERNISAFHNYFVVNMLLENGDNHTAIDVNLYFLESKFYQKFVSAITDSTFKITAKELQIDFLNEIVQEIDQGTVNLSLSEFIKIIKSTTFSAKDNFIASFVAKKIEYIETKIKEARGKRKNSKENAASSGEKLCREISGELEMLNDLVGTDNIKYSSIADKVADEILQCGIDYFLHYRDTDRDPSNIAMNLLQTANKFAVGGYAKERCRENVENLQEWIDEAPERVKLSEIRGEINFITAQLEHFQELSPAILSAKNLLYTCKPKLIDIQNQLGSTDDFYLNISSAVVACAQRILVSVVNAAQKMFTHNLISLDTLESTINEAYNVAASMQSMDMVLSLKHQYKENINTLANIRKQVHSASKRGSGCYVATMVYGDYDHPQVLILRQFRDGALSKSAYGKWFIRAYYRYSPKLVEHLKDRTLVNIVIRFILNLFIKTISK